jgi:hypothetical protein
MRGTTDPQPGGPFAPARFREDYARQAEALRRLIPQARARGGRIYGLTVAELEAKAAEYEALACASDAAIRERLGLITKNGVSR